MRNREMGLLVILTVALCCLMAGCSDDAQTTGGQTLPSYITAGAFYNQTDGSYVVADVTRGGTTVTSATINVNGTALTYGIPLTCEGVTLGTVSLYSGEVNFNPGDVLTLRASLPGENPFYEGNVIVPEEIFFNQPPPVPQVIAGNPLNTSWNATLNTLFYYLYYSPWDDTDYYEETTTQLAGTIPSAYVIEGNTELSVSSFNGNDLDDIFAGDDADLGENDPDPAQTKSYWLASTYDYREFDVEPQQAKEDEAEVLFEDSSGRPVVALQILKEDRVNIKGITFTRRIYNAQQITSSGTAQIQVKLKKNHLAIADISVMDSSEKVYFNWNHKREYKSHSKTYSHNIPITPFSTVVIHTKSCDLHYANYSY